MFPFSSEAAVAITSHLQRFHRYTSPTRSAPKKEETLPISRQRIAVYLPALVGGGAERVAAVLASGLSSAGLDVTLIVDFEALENRSFVADSVAMVTLGGGHGRSIIRLSRLMVEQRFDVVLAIGASANIKLVAAHVLSRTATRLILSYHGSSTAGRGLLGWAAYPLAPLLTRYAARTVCVSDCLIAHMAKTWRAPPNRVARIYNPIPVDCAQPPATAAELSLRPPTIVALGRLVAAKDFANLITAFALVPQRDSRLVIYGEGPERDALQRLAQQLDLGGRVELPGYVKGPMGRLRQGSLLRAAFPH